MFFLEDFVDILRSIWFKIGLVVFYLISPKFFTEETWLLMKAKEYRAEVRDVLYAQFMENGDVKTCLLLDIKPSAISSEYYEAKTIEEMNQNAVKLAAELNRKAEPYQVELPIAALTRHDHPRVKERETEIRERFWPGFLFGIDENRMKKGCDPASETSDIYVADHRTYGRLFNGRVEPSEPEFRAELYIGEWTSEIFYISREPLRHGRYSDQLDDGSIVTKDLLEYNVDFIFPSHFTGMRWWYAALLPFAVVTDAVLAPVEWWMLLHQKH